MATSPSSGSMSDMEKNISKRPGVFAASGLYLLAAIGLWLVFLASDRLGAGLVAVWPGITTEWANLIVNFLYYVPFLLLPVGIWAVNRDDGADCLRLNPVSFGQTLVTVFIALLTMLIVYNASIFWMAIWQKLGLNVFVDDYIRPANTAELTRSIVAGAIIAPVCEEVLFRGAMLSAWEAKGTRRAVAVTAVMFALLHGSLLGLPGEIFGGIILALVVIWTDSLYAGMIFHSAYNASSLLMSYVTSGVELEETAEAAALMETNLLAYLGGWSAAAMLVFDIALMLLMLTFLLRRLHVVAVLRRIQQEMLPEASALETIQRIRAGELQVDRDRIRALQHNDFIPADKTPLSTGETLLLLSGVVSGLGLYFFDIISMLGG